MDKIQAWEQRGRRSLSIEEVEDVFNRLPFVPLPKELIILDGVIQVAPKRMAVGATPNLSRDMMILTPLSNEDTVVHEAIHRSGLGEIAAYGVAPVLDARRRFNLGLLRRQVRFTDAGSLQESELRNRLSLASPMVYQEMKMCYNLQMHPELPAEIKVYRLIT